MDKKTDQEKKCWSCKRSLMDNEGELGLCPSCINKYATPPVAVLGSLGAGLLIKFFGKFFPEVAKKIKL